MNKQAGVVDPQPPPWRRLHDCGQPEGVRPLRDPDERVFLAAFWSWRLYAACRGDDTELFYSPEGERGLARTARERAAKAICATCPVKAPCAAYALQHHERYGVWGGLTESERAYRWSQAAAHPSGGRASGVVGNVAQV